jgi:hypothetical protein
LWVEYTSHTIGTLRTVSIRILKQRTIAFDRGFCMMIVPSRLETMESW